MSEFDPAETVMDSSQDPALEQSINTLAERFSKNPWIEQEVPGVSGATHYLWYGRPDEEIVVNVFKGRKLHEPFHRHDFFFIDYAYCGDYQTFSGSADNLITMHEGELYVS